MSALGGLAGISPYLQASMLPTGLPFGGGGGVIPMGGDPGALSGAYTSAYQSALAQNQALYRDIVSGYQNVRQGMTGPQQAIMKGYPQLASSIMGTLGVGAGGAVGPGGAANPTGNWGVAAPAAQAIGDVYAQQSGGLKQNLISSGLGNTTVAGQMQRGPALDAAKAYGALGAQLAETAAGYQANLGLSGLNFANQANMQNVGQANQQLGFMNTVTAQYPNAQLYGQLAQQFGATGQANLNRAMQERMFNRSLGAVGGAGGGGGTISRAPKQGVGDWPSVSGGGGAGFNDRGWMYPAQPVSPQAAPVPSGYAGPQTEDLQGVQDYLDAQQWASMGEENQPDLSGYAGDYGF